MPPWDRYAAPAPPQAAPAQPSAPYVVGTPRPAPPPSGYRPNGGGLAPIPGGPADPSRSPPSGYRSRPDGGLEAIPGGPADPDRNLRGPSGDSNRSGAEYLSTIPDAARRAQAQALAEGRIPWPSGRAASDPHWQQIIADAIQYDPSLDAATSARRRAAITQFTGNGAAAQRVGSANRLANHLRDLYTASERLVGPDLGQSTINSLAAAVGQTFEPADAGTYDTAANAVANELERYFRGSGGSEADIARTISNLSRHQSLETRRAAIREVVSLIHGAMGPLQSQYNDAFQQGTARPPITWIDPGAQRTYQELGGADFSLPGATQPPSGQRPSGGAPGAPPTVLGTPSGGPTGGGGPAPGTPPLNAGPSPTVNVSSDTPPSQEVTPDYVRQTQEVQALFDGGASREQLDEFNRRHGRPAFGPLLDQAIQYRDNGGRGARILPPEATTAAGAQAGQLNDLQGQLGASDLFLHGATFGLSDEAAGAAGAIYNAVSSPFTDTNFDPATAYQTSRDAERIRLGEARDHSGWLGTGTELLGGFAGGNPTSLVGSAGPALGGRMLAGARGGAEVGALSGYGNGNGLGGSLRGAAVGAGTGAFVGTAAPLAGEGVNALRGVTRTMMGRNPDLAQRTIANALTADANTPRLVGQEMQQAQANGVPYMLADSGDNARGLLAASARAPGPGRTLARDALEQRQAGLGERVSGAVERDLGAASNPHEVNDALMAQARTQAAPLYDQAYAAPGADRFASKVAGLMQRPAMRQAMARARSIAQEEGRDPAELGFAEDAQGNVILASPRQTRVLDQRGQPIPAPAEPVMRRNPSWQTMDYVKRGLDDVLQAQPRDPATGRLRLDEGTRAIQGTLRSFVSQFDQANPSYAAARAAWGGPVRAREAMDIGRRALNLNADDLAARTRDLSPNELEFVRLGVRRALVEAVSGKGDTANVVNTIIGTPKRRAMLARLFGGRRDFDRFTSTLQAEQEGFRTFHRATQGSPTAPNLQDDAHLNSAVATGMVDLATTGLPVATLVKHAIQFGTSRAGREAQQEIATLLSETDPTRLMELSRELRKQAFRTRQRGRGAGRRAVGYGVSAGNAAGDASGD